jgi:hypothetical protein
MKVEAIMGQPFEFTVSSRSNPTAVHYCNWLEVTCSCPGFSFKNREHRGRTGKNYVCAHLQAAKDHCWEEILEHTREELLAQ